MLLFACGECQCHFRPGEPRCPHCGAPVSGVPPRTRAAVLLGLLAGAAIELGACAAYGVAVQTCENEESQGCGEGFVCADRRRSGGAECLEICATQADCAKGEVCEDTSETQKLCVVACEGMDDCVSGDRCTDGMCVRIPD